LKKRVSCYIDGFNLYHAIADISPTQHYLKWVNLWDLSKAFLKTSNEKLTNVYYFSALAYWLEGPKSRHLKYIEANNHFGVTSILGNFKERKVECKRCKAVWKTHEEKQSDVNIAAYLVHHSHLDLFDKAFIISADSDLCHAIDLVQRIAPPNRFSAGAS